MGETNTHELLQLKIWEQSGGRGRVSRDKNFLGPGN